jgi:hypothetical protein
MIFHPGKEINRERQDEQDEEKELFIKLSVH